MKTAQRSTLMRVIITSCILWLGVIAPAIALGPDPDAPWNLLGTATFSEKIVDEQWFATKIYPDPLRAAAKDFAIEGFVVPLQAQPYFKSFLLVQDPANCPFCGGNSGYAPVLEVILKAPIKEVPEFSQISLKGDLEFNENPDTLQMFYLVDAVVVE